MKKYLMIFAFMAFFFTNCSKEDPTEFAPLTEAFSSETASRSNKGGSLEIDPFLRDVFEQNKGFYQQTVDPYLYVPSKLRDQLKLNYIQESNRLQALGLESYLSALVSDRVINQELADTYMAVNTAVKSFEKATKADIPLLMQELDGFRKSINISSTLGKEAAPLSKALAMILLHLESEYGEWLNGDSAQPRGDCPFGEALTSALDLGTTLGILGTVAAVTAAALSLPITATFAFAIISYSFLVGFVTGFFSGLFGLPTNNICDDCITPEGISLIYQEDCSMTRTLNAFGSGDDANSWEWALALASSPTATTSVVTSVPTLTVTQVNPLDPIVASVRPICANEVDFYTQTIDLSTSTGPLGEVGSLNVAPGDANQTYNINEEVDFIMFNTNQASGNIEFSISAPSSIVHIEEEGDNYFTLGFHNTGTATVTFTATNTCSGLTTTDSVTLTITN